MPSDYMKNLPQKMADFHNSHQDATKVLNAYNTVDPFHCYFGEDCNPDEYLGYAERFLRGEGSTFRRVVKSFYDSQIKDGWVNAEVCEQIADIIDDA